MSTNSTSIEICVRTAQKARWESFDKTFSKVFRAPAAKRRSRVATRETPLNGAFLFCELFSFAPTWSKEKSGVTSLGMLTATHGNSLAAFLLAEKGAREKLTKENAVWGVSPSAEGEEGFAPSTCASL